MRAVIRFTNGYGETEYWNGIDFCKSIDDAEVYDKDEAESIIHRYKNSPFSQPIWISAVVRKISLVETEL